MTGYSAHDLISLVGSKSGVFHEEVDKSTNQCKSHAASKINCAPTTV